MAYVQATVLLCITTCCLHMLCCIAGFARGHQSESASAQAAFRIHQVPGQDLQRLAHCHSPAGVTCCSVSPRESFVQGLMALLLLLYKHLVSFLL